MLSIKKLIIRNIIITTDVLILDIVLARFVGIGLLFATTGAHQITRSPQSIIIISLSGKAKWIVVPAKIPDEKMTKLRIRHPQYVLQ